MDYAIRTQVLSTYDHVLLQSYFPLFGCIAILSRDRTISVSFYGKRGVRSQCCVYCFVLLSHIVLVLVLRHGGKKKNKTKLSTRFSVRASVNEVYED